MAGLEALLLPLLPRYQTEGKSYLTIAFGCTGGKHRSVFLAELLGDWLRRAGWEATTIHRELATCRGAGVRTARMIGLVLVTHGRLAAEFVAAMEHVVGPQPQTRARSASAPTTTSSSGAARSSTRSARSTTAAASWC